MLKYSTTFVEHYTAVASELLNKQHYVTHRNEFSLKAEAWYAAFFDCLVSRISSVEVQKALTLQHQAKLSYLEHSTSPVFSSLYEGMISSCLFYIQDCLFAY